MDTSTPRFDLVDIVQTIQKRFRFILIVTLAAAVVGCIVYLMKTKEYHAKATFLVSNPQYADRNNLFRVDRGQIINYFGTEDDIDKVMAIAKSETTKGEIIAKTNLVKLYKVDTSSIADVTKFGNRFGKNFDVKRTEYQNMEISYTDEDPQLAADVVNTAVQVTENIYSSYFTDLRNHAQMSLEVKLKETDSVIHSLTDSLASMRDRYQIYDILSPDRLMLSANSERKGRPGYGKAMEEIQNIEATKDRLLTDRTQYLSLINEFSTGTKAGQLPLLKVLTPASRPNVPAGLGVLVTTVVCGLVAFFFSSLWVLLAAYFRTLTSVVR